MSQNLSEVIQLIFSGVSQGCIYALLAIAYNITFSTSRTVNFSLGSVLMLGAVAGFAVSMDMATGQSLGRHFVIPVLAVFAVGAILGGLIFGSAVLPSMKSKLSYASILATLALAGILRNLTERFWSTDDHRILSPLGETPYRILGAGVLPQETLIVTFAFFFVSVFEWFRRRTKWGRAIQAVSEDSETAKLMGINPMTVILLSYFLSSILAAFAGWLVAPIVLVSASMGVMVGIKAYVVSIIGGLESGYGALLGGVLLGLSEAFTARYLSTGYRDLTGFALLLLIVLLRPNGLLGQGRLRKV